MQKPQSGCRIKSKTVSWNDGTYMCTPQDIMIFTEAYKSVMSTQFQEDRFEIKKIENGENRDGIRNFSFS